MVKSIIRKILNSLSYYKLSSEDYFLFRKHYKNLLFADFKMNSGGKNLNYLHLEKSQSQLIQDLIVINHFDLKKGGNFIEFGATDGITLSNTYQLENDFSWDGVLIEPVKTSFLELKNNRNVICLNKVVFNKKNIINFHEDVSSELSTIEGFSNSDLNKRKKKTTYEVEAVTLNEIFKESLKTNYVDFISIDTEGTELIILENFNFKKYKFGFLCVEHNFTDNREKIHELLIENGYKRIYVEYSKWDDFYVPN